MGDNWEKLPSRYEAAEVRMQSTSTFHQPSEHSMPEKIDEREASTSFGEPLSVNMTRATSRFKSIQRSLSMDRSHRTEEEGSGFDLTEWLTGRQQKHGPPFAKRVGLVFDNVDVYGDNVANRHIGTVITPLYKALKSAVRGFGLMDLGKGKGKEHKQLLHGMSGVVEDGEMLLVLGQPGAGCSTLLRVLGNRRNTYRKITGTVSYGGLDPDTVSRHYRGEVAYNQEDDVHFATLTVRKTLAFAVRCKMPNKTMLEDRAGYEAEFLDTLLDMYGLTKCADTVVGNAFVRGASGGERKRVSIAEQIASGASVDVWDGSTRGLDSSSALDYVRSLRVTTDVLHKATIVTLYQASENIYRLFDKVMVVDRGRQLYFGPVTEAVDYFAALGIYKPPRQTTSDFLTGVTQIHERSVLPGWEDKAPKTPEDFEKCWLASVQYQRVKDQIDRFSTQIQQDNRGHEFTRFVDQTKMGTSKIRRRSPYTTTFMYQIVELFAREWEIFIGARAQLIFKIGYNAAFAIIVGTLFLRLPEDTSGAFTRGGALFFALLFNTLTAQGEIPKAVADREIVYKHKAFALYHPAALSLAQTIVDVPFVLLQIVVFSCILYWTTGMAATAGQFFAFVLYLFVGCLCLTAFFRLIGNVSPHVDVAHTLSGLSLLFMILYVGYLIPPGSMHGWFVWIYWINPLAYGFKALCANEFRNLKLKCVGTSLVPQVAGFGIENQVCTLQGSRPGQDYVLGSDYIAAGYQFYVKDQWKNFIAVVLFWVLFVVLTAVVMENVEFGNTGYTINVYKRRKPTIQASRDDSPQQKTTNGTTYTWKAINYTVPVKGGERMLLRDVSGYIKPGTMTALMGASGAGKTTLLDSLSQRKTIGTLEGEMLINGRPQPASFRRITGYCEQLDVHNPHATVREALRFSAYLRQSASTPDSEKDAYVERVITLLGMKDIADCLIGNVESGEGISLEERKRLTIGVELVARPKILFLDEPTSGLDAQAAFTIVHFLRRLSEVGQTILCTIHQPSALLFEQFDRLLLLVRGGHTVYCGDIGHDAQTLIQYFEMNGARKCPSKANPAEYILDVIGKQNINWPQVWDTSNEKQAVLSEIDRINELKVSNDSQDDNDSMAYSRSHAFQIMLVTARMFRSYWRDPDYNLTRLALQILTALALGFSFYQLGESSADLQNKVFVIFQSAVLSILIINQVQPQYLRQRQYYARESSANQYSWRAFSIAIIFTEWPFAIVSNTVFFVCFYWTAGLNTNTDRIGYFYISYILLGLFSLSLGQAIASFSKNDIIAAMFNPIFTAMVILFCGVTSPYNAMPKFWRSWMYWLSPYMYYIEGVITNDLYNAPVVCKSDEFFVFQPPQNSTCKEYAGDWVSSYTGYLDNENDSSECRYCQYSLGQEYYTSLSWSFDHRWRNFGILAAFCAFNILFTIVMVKIFKVNKR